MSRFNWKLGSDPIRDGWLIVYAADLYYNSLDDQSPLTDSEFDQLKDICLIRWTELDSRVKGILKSPEDARASTFYVSLTRLEKYLAIKYIYKE